MGRNANCAKPVAAAVRAASSSDTSMTSQFITGQGAVHDP